MEYQEDELIPQDYQSYEMEECNEGNNENISSFIPRDPRLTIIEKLVENPESIRAVGDAGAQVIDAAGHASARVIDSVGYAGSQVIDSAGNAGSQVIDSAGNAGSRIIDSAGNAGSQVIDSAGYAGSRIIDSAGYAGSQVIDSIGNARTQVIDARGHADARVIDAVGTNLNAVKIGADLISKRMDLDMVKEKTKQVQAVTNPEFVRAVGSYKNIDSALKSSYIERKESLQDLYKLLKSPNQEDRKYAMLAISQIVSSSPLETLEKIEDKYRDPSQPLLDF